VSSTRKKKILIVDDDFTSRRLLERIVRDNFKASIRTAEDGSEALQEMVKDIPDLLILDMVMPVLNGIQVLRTMQETHKLAHVPVIACTAVGDNSVVTEILKYGVKDYIKKPIQPDAVIKRIRAVMDSKPST